MATKRCPVCGEEFSKNPRYSLAQWERATYCSRKCQAAGCRMERALCACGCGERVVKPRSRYRKGHNDHPERRKSIKFDGRRWYVFDREGRKVYWARIVLMDKLGRKLDRDEIAHHINGDCTDDRPENLEAKTSHAVHMREHHAKGDLHDISRR